MAPTHFIFNHIPKTGGTSLLAVFREKLQPAEISPHLDDHEIRPLSATRFEGYRLIAGHFSVLAQMGFSRNRYSLTLLRDPIKRIFSAYTFWRKSTDHNLLTCKAKELPFEDFVLYFRDSPSVIDNPYVHHFAAVGRDFTGYPADTTSLLATAKHNLAAFDFVGICEEMERSTRLLCHELDWITPAEIPHENRASSPARFREIEPETMEVLRDRNQLDSELYEYAVDLFHAREAVATNSAAANRRPIEPNRFVPFPSPLEIGRRAIIHSVSTKWAADESPGSLEVGVNFTTLAPVADLNMGVLITDAAGNIVWGTNTENEDLNLRYEVGRDTCAAFLVGCELPAGVYSVTVALAEQRRLGFHEHWIDRAAIFTVVAPQVDGARSVHSVQLQQFWSTITDGWSHTRPPWRSASEPDGQVVDGRLQEQWTARPEDPHTSRLPLQPPLNHPAEFHPQAFFDIDAKLSNPRVCLRLEHHRVEMGPENRQRVYVNVTNLGDEVLSSRYAFPVKLSYHWMSDDRTVKQRDGLRSGLPFDILPACSATVEAIIDPPPDPSCSLLCITLVQEHVLWFDDCDLANRLILRFDGLHASAA